MCRFMQMVFLGALLLSGAVGVAAEETDGRVAAAELDLGTMLQLVASESHAAVMAAADLEAAAAARDRVRAGWWPQVDLAAQYLVRDNPVEALAGDIRFPTMEKSGGQYSLALRELLWDGGRRGLAVAAADRQAEAQVLGGLAAVRQAQLAALDVYLGALELNGRRKVLDQRLAMLESHLRDARERFSQGLTARNDLLETEVRVREAADQSAAVADRQAVSRQELNRRLGRDPLTEITLPDSLPAPPTLAGGRDLLLQAAGEHNIGLQAAAARLAVGQAGVDLARRAWFPSFFVGAAHAYTENRYLVHETINSVMAGLTWNIFDGGARAADTRQARAHAVAAGRDRLEVERAVAVAVDSAWRRWEQAQRELQTAEVNVAASLENLRIVEDQYRGGVARSSDVLDAETLLTQSRYEVVHFHYATYRAQAELVTVAGQDPAVFYGTGSTMGKE